MGAGDMLVVWQLDRLGRELINLLALKPSPHSLAACGLLFGSHNPKRSKVRIMFVRIRMPSVVLTSMTCG
nr:recombinase family protein [Pseudomonas aeruginosa]